MRERGGRGRAVTRREGEIDRGKRRRVERKGEEGGKRRSGKWKEKENKMDGDGKGYIGRWKERERDRDWKVEGEGEK